MTSFKIPKYFLTYKNGHVLPWHYWSRYRREHTSNEIATPSSLLTFMGWSRCSIGPHLRFRFYDRSSSFSESVDRLHGVRNYALLPSVNNLFLWCVWSCNACYQHERRKRHWWLEICWCDQREFVKLNHFLDASFLWCVQVLFSLLYLQKS